MPKSQDSLICQQQHSKRKHCLSLSPNPTKNHIWISWPEAKWNNRLKVAKHLYSLLRFYSRFEKCCWVLQFVHVFNIKNKEKSDLKNKAILLFSRKNVFIPRIFEFCRRYGNEKRCLFRQTLATADMKSRSRWKVEFECWNVNDWQGADTNMGLMSAPPREKKEAPNSSLSMMDDDDIWYDDENEGKRKKKFF